MVLKRPQHYISFNPKRFTISEINHEDMNSARKCAYIRQTIGSPIRLVTSIFSVLHLLFCVKHVCLISIKGSE